MAAITRNAFGIVSCIRAASLPTTPSINGLQNSGLKPEPITASPTIMPRLSGNHFTRFAIGVTYANPPPIPAMNPYPSTKPDKLSPKKAEIRNPIATSTPPTDATSRAPLRSCHTPPMMVPTATMTS
jgi:hypothetical protein